MKKVVIELIPVLLVIIGISTVNVQAQDNDQPATAEKTENETKKKSSEDQYYEKPAKFSYSFDGEIHYNDVVQDLNEANPTGELDFHKFAVKSSYYLSSAWSVASKVIVEHSFDPNYDGGDVYVSNLYVKYKYSKKFYVTSGVISVPTSGGKKGFYGTVELSPVEKYLSYAWREAGIGVAGSLNDNISYKATLTSGLDPYELSSKSVIYSARNHDFFASLNNVATGVQLVYDNDYDVRFGFSALYSGLNKSGESSETFDGANYTFGEVFGAYKIGYVGTRAVATFSSIQGIEEINEVFHNKAGSAHAGALFEVSYDFSRFLNNDSQHLCTILRSEYYDSQFRTTGISDNSKYEHYDYSLGIVYQPIKSLEIKADYQIQRFGDKYSSQLFDLSLGFHF
ncbi:MAG: hypothetical protein ACPGGA_03940 [Balneolaceae bacterium]